MIEIGTEATPRPYRWDPRRWLLQPVACLGAGVFTFGLMILFAQVVRSTTGKMPGDFLLQSPHLEGIPETLPQLTADLMNRGMAALLLFLAVVVGLYLLSYAFLSWRSPSPEAAKLWREQRHAGPNPEDPARWAPALDEGEEARAAFLVDLPSGHRPGRILVLAWAMIVLHVIGLVTPLSAYLTAGTLLLDAVFLAAFACAPLAPLAVAALHLGDGLLLFAGVTMALAVPYVYYCIVGAQAMAVATREPVILAAWALALAFGVWLAYQWWTRRRRFLLVTTRGFRLVASDPRGTTSLGGPVGPATLERHPGPHGERWVLRSDDAEALAVYPVADDAEALRDAAKSAGVDLETGEAPAPESLVTEARRVGPRALVPVLFLALAWSQFFTCVHFGLLLGQGIIVYLADSRDSHAGAEKMKISCQKVLDAYPEEPVGLGFLAIMEHTAGNYEVAKDLSDRIHRAVEGLRYPELLEKSQTMRLARSVRESLEEEGVAERTGPPAGWEPPEPDTARFRYLADRLLGYRHPLWVTLWPEDLRELKAMADRHPASPGPRVLLAMTYVHPDRDLRGLVEDLLDPGGDGSAIERRIRIERALTNLLRPIEVSAAWTGLVERIARPRWRWNSGMDLLVRALRCEFDPADYLRCPELPTDLAATSGVTWIQPSESRQAWADGIKLLARNPPEEIAPVLALWDTTIGDLDDEARALANFLDSLRDRGLEELPELIRENPELVFEVKESGRIGFRIPFHRVDDQLIERKLLPPEVLAKHEELRAAAEARRQREIEEYLRKKRKKSWFDPRTWFR